MMNESNDDDDVVGVISKLLQSSKAATNSCFDESDPLYVTTLKGELYLEWNKAFEGVNDAANIEKKSTFQGNEVTDEWFERLYNQHNERESRFYHTAIHLYEMCHYWNLVAASSDDSAIQSQEQQSIIRLSIFFHDAIYNAKSSTNEIDSAALFLQFVSNVKSNTTTTENPPSTTSTTKTAISSWVASQVVTYILATQSHQIASLKAPETPILSSSQHFGQALFLDLDMAVLGKESGVAYPAYAKCIRQEYIHILYRPDYCQGRSTVLQSFLDNESSIYYTTYFRDAFERRARDNLKKEIEVLQHELKQPPS